MDPLFCVVVFDLGNGLASTQADVHRSRVDDLEVHAFVFGDRDQGWAPHEGAEFRMSDGSDVVAFFLDVASVEPGLDHRGGQSREIDLGADRGHVFLRPERVLVNLLGFCVVAQAVLVDQVDAKNVLIAVDDDMEVVLHFMPNQFEVQGIDADAFEDFVAGTSKVGSPFGESLLLPIVSEELPHGRGSDDRSAGAGVVETASFLSVDSHVQSGSLFPLNRSNLLFSSFFIVQEVGCGTDTENCGKDASSKSTARGSCRTQ